MNIFAADSILFDAQNQGHDGQVTHFTLFKLFLKIPLFVGGILDNNAKTSLL